MNGYKLMVVVLLCCLIGTLAFSKDYVLKLSGVNLEEVLKEYTKLTGRNVEIVKNVDGQFNIGSESVITKDQAVKIIENELKKNNIQLFEIASNRFVAAWADLAKVNDSSSCRFNNDQKAVELYMKKLRALKASQGK